MSQAVQPLVLCHHGLLNAPSLCFLLTIYKEHPFLHQLSPSILRHDIYCTSQVQLSTNVSPGYGLKRQLPGPHPRSAQSEPVGQDPAICILKMHLKAIPGQGVQDPVLQEEVLVAATVLDTHCARARAWVERCCSNPGLPLPTVALGTCFAY